jgi:hypothetical protein
MARNGGNWLKLLRSHLGIGEVSIDLPAALEHPDPVIRVLAAGVVWGRTGGRQPELVLPHIATAIRSGERWGKVFGCQLLAQLGRSAGDIVPLVWDLLADTESGVRFNAAFALLKCCPDKRVLAQARQFLDGDADYATQYVAAKLQAAIEAEPGAPPNPAT